MAAYYLDDSNAAHFAKMPHWTFEEAIALLLGKNPTVALQKNRFNPDSAFTQQIEYRELEQIFSRSAHMIGYSDEYRPQDVLAWALHFEVEVPSILIEKVEKFHGSLEQWNPRKGFMAAWSKPSTVESNPARIEPIDVKPPSESATGNLGTRERDTLLYLIGTMAVSKYGFTPKKRNSAATAILKDMTDIGVEPMSEDTVRNKLKEASDLIPQSYFSKEKRGR